MSAPDLLGVTDVMARYGMRDRRAARAVMDAAGSFKVGSRVFVHAEALVDHENALAAQRRSAAPANVGVGSESPRRPRRRTRPQARPEGPMQAGWWRQAS